jgi:hypothetical protein
MILETQNNVIRTVYIFFNAIQVKVTVISVDVVSNHRISNEWWNVKLCGRNMCWYNLGHYVGIGVGAQIKPHETSVYGLLRVGLLVFAMVRVLFAYEWCDVLQIGCWAQKCGCTVAGFHMTCWPSFILASSFTTPLLSTHWRHKKYECLFFYVGFR